jgi:hypothetical protein
MLSRLVSLPFVVALAVGCSAPTSESEEQETESSHSELTSFGGYVADVTAAGSGCPAGSWNAAISPDGQTFTLTFSAYEVKVSPGQLFDIKQCVINVGFRDPQGLPLSFIVGSIYHQGYALLDSPGMRAARNSTYVFSANGASVKGPGSPSQHAEITGPYESSYLQTDNVFAGVWSPCASVSNLVVNTNLMLQNNAQRSGSGYLNAATVDGRLTVAFRLAWRHC